MICEICFHGISEPLSTRFTILFLFWTFLGIAWDMRGFYSVATRCRHLLWFTESLWKHVEVWYYEGSSYCWSPWPTPCFIEGFLESRQFYIRPGACISDLFDQQIGVPQGSILSVTLFGLFNSIIKAISPGVKRSLYINDFLICYRSKHFHIIEWHLQQCLSKLPYWADTNGFKFSSSKTVCIHFCRLRKLHLEPQLFLNGTPIPVVKETKFLGIIFNCKLSFLPHIQHLKYKC